MFRSISYTTFSNFEIDVIEFYHRLFVVISMYFWELGKWNYNDKAGVAMFMLS